MKHLQKKASLSLKSGTTITGKWHQQRYTIVHRLGEGMVGTVYLCRNNGKHVALKISEQPLAMTAEVQVLKSLQKVQGGRLGPYLMDVDDWETKNGQAYSFYVMEYIHGVGLRTFIAQKGSDWVGLLLLQMLEQLESLHRAGWVFGDLKNENILVTEQPFKVRFIDVGGTTKIGRSIKEYTAFYDRAYWLLGKRTAEASYDLFAVVMVVLSIYYPQQFARTKNPLPYLRQKIVAQEALRLYAPSLLKALSGKYDSARAMRDDIVQTLFLQKEKKRAQNEQPLAAEVLLVLLTAGAYYALYYFLF